MGSSGSGSAPRRYLDPERVFWLVRHHQAQGLFDCLNSVPGALEDLQCRLVSFAGTALRASGLGSPPFPDLDTWALYWANYARDHARISSLCAPQMAGYPSFPARRHAAINNQFEASSSSTPTAMLPPQRTNYNSVINSPMTLALRHASDFAPWGNDPTLHLAFAKLSLGQPGSEQMAPQELMQNNPAMGLPFMHQPRPAQLTPQRLMQNREVDIKGKGPATEVYEQKVLVHVATFMVKDGTRGAAGLLITDGTRQLLCASYFPMLVTEPVLFAAACCEGIKIARAYQPSTIVVVSHLFHLLWPYLVGVHAPFPQMVELVNWQDPPRCTVGSITEERNSTACQLAVYSLAYWRAEIFFDALPGRFVLT